MRLALAVALAAAGCGDAPCPSTAIDKGPWTMRMTGDGASVYWETRDEPACVQLTLAGRAYPGGATRTEVKNTYGVDVGLKMPDLAGTYYVNRVDITGLSPGCYDYQISSTA